MAHFNSDDPTELLVAIVVAVLLTLLVVSLMIYCVIVQTARVADEESGPLLSPPRHSTPTKHKGETVQALTIDANEASRADLSRRHSNSKASVRLNSPLTVIEHGFDQQDRRHSSAYGTLDGAGINTIAGHAATASTPMRPESPLGLARSVPHMIGSLGLSLPRKILQMDGTTETAGASDTKHPQATQARASSFLEHFTPTAGIVEAMKAKNKGPDVGEVQKVCQDPPPQEAAPNDSGKSKGKASVEARPVALYTVSDAANDPNYTSLYDVKLGGHRVQPPGAFPISPEQTGECPNITGQAENMKRKRSLTASKLPKRRQVSKNSQSAEAPSAQAGQEQRCPTAEATATTEQQPRRSSAPSDAQGSQRGGKSSTRSQRKHYRKKASSDAGTKRPSDK